METEIKRTSFKETMKQVKEQISFEDFYNPRIKSINPQVSELCLIITEVLLLDPSEKINIESKPMSVHLVQEIYESLRKEHIEFVIENFNSATNIVRTPKSYLRTALYNALFEYENHCKNQIKHDYLNN